MLINTVPVSPYKHSENISQENQHMRTLTNIWGHLWFTDTARLTSTQSPEPFPHTIGTNPLISISH